MKPMDNPEYYTRLFIQRLEAYSNGEAISRDGYIPWSERDRPPETDWELDDDSEDIYQGLNKERLGERITVLEMLWRIAQHENAPIHLVPIQFPNVNYKDFFGEGVDLESYGLHFPWLENLWLDVEVKSTKILNMQFQPVGEITIKALTVDCPILHGVGKRELTLVLDTWLRTGMQKPVLRGTLGTSAEPRVIICLQQALHLCGLKSTQRQTLHNWIRQSGLEKGPGGRNQYFRDTIEQLIEERNYSSEG